MLREFLFFKWCRAFTMLFRCNHSVHSVFIIIIFLAHPNVPLQIHLNSDGLIQELSKMNNS